MFKSLEKYLLLELNWISGTAKCYVSLVGFMFKETKVSGFKIPFDVDLKSESVLCKRFENGEWKRCCFL